MKTLSIALLLSVTVVQCVRAADQEEKARLEKLFQQLRAPAVSEEEQHQQMLQEYPMVRKSEKLLTAFVQSETALYDKAAMQKRIAEERMKWDERERQRLTDVMRYFSMPIRRVFREDAQDQLARLAISAVKAYEQDKSWGFSVAYRWLQNDDNTRSLECIIDASPETLMAAYNSSQND